MSSSFFFVDVSEKRLKTERGAELWRSVVVDSDGNYLMVLPLSFLCVCDTCALVCVILRGKGKVIEMQGLKRKNKCNATNKRHSKSKKRCRNMGMCENFFKDSFFMYQRNINEKEKKNFFFFRSNSSLEKIRFWSATDLI